jgi:hypothetical protein
VKAFFAFLAVMFLALPAWAVDVQMGNNGQLVFEPSEISISAGDSIHFVNNVSFLTVDSSLLLGNPLIFPLILLGTIPFGVILTKEQE